MRIQLIWTKSFSLALDKTLKLSPEGRSSATPFLLSTPLVVGLLCLGISLLRLGAHQSIFNNSFEFLLVLHQPDVQVLLILQLDITIEFLAHTGSRKLLPVCQTEIEDVIACPLKVFVQSC